MSTEKRKPKMVYGAECKNCNRVGYIEEHVKYFYCGWCSDKSAKSDKLKTKPMGAPPRTK